MKKKFSMATARFLLVVLLFPIAISAIVCDDKVTARKTPLSVYIYYFLSNIPIL